MTKPDDTRRLRHMLEAAEKAVAFTQDADRESLAEDELLCLGVVRLLEIIGEAAARVSKETRDLHQEVEWPQIVGMRNRLIHGYDQIDLDVLSQTLTEDLPPPPLIEKLRDIINNG